MNYKIYPLTFTAVNWQQLIDICQDVLGYSPTRGLDKHGLDVKNPGAYLACLNLDNEPFEALRKQSKIYNHIMMSFICVADEYLILDLFKIVDLQLHFKGERTKIIILSGTIKQWLDAVLICCSPNIQKSIRELFNKIYEYLSNTYYGEIFYEYKKIRKDDDTFILVKD